MSIDRGLAKYIVVFLQLLKNMAIKNESSTYVIEW